MRSGGGPSRAILRLCLNKQCQPLMGEKLFNKFEAIMGWAALFTHSPLTAWEREDLLNAFLMVCEWVPVLICGVQICRRRGIII